MLRRKNREGEDRVIEDVYEIARRPFAVETWQLKPEYDLTLQNGLSVRITRLDHADRSFQNGYSASYKRSASAACYADDHYQREYVLRFDLPETRVYALCPTVALALAIAALCKDMPEDALVFCFKIFVGRQKLDIPPEKYDCRLRTAMAQAIRYRLDPNVALLLFA